MTEQFLGLQIRLLLLQYGREKVISKLATLGDSTIDEIERQMSAYSKKRMTPAQNRKRSASILELAEVACREHPAIAEPLRALALGFHNRAFLPNLRDVNRFLEGMDEKPRKLKSREAAAPAVLEALKRLSNDQLMVLSSEIGAAQDSDFSALARAIMRLPSDKSVPR